MRRSILGFSIGLIVGTSAQTIQPWNSPEYKDLWSEEMPVPPTLKPITSYTSSRTGKKIDYYEIVIRPFTKQIYPNLRATPLVGYNGMFPGPTFEVADGTETVVRVINDMSSPNPGTIHLHGSYSRAPFDGWADDQIKPGMYKDYYYPNSQGPRTMWYHDHAYGFTAKNVFSGQAGIYIVEDAKLDRELGLPVGHYDVPLVISSGQYNQNGTLFDFVEARFDGDVLSVNGQPWPYFKVEPRKYRFRLLDADITRGYFLYLVADSASTVEIPFNVIASDSGYLSKPVSTPDVIMSPGERYEIVIDFEKFKGQNLTMMNRRGLQDTTDFPQTDKILKFVVGTKVRNTEGNADLPKALAKLDIPKSKTDVDYTFNFELVNNRWLINKVGFSDVRNRILAFPTRGEVQRWKLINNNPAFAITHPIHLHLVDFTIVSRTGGRNVVQPYESAGLKDIAVLGANETIEILARFAPWAGVYMFHCHNLIHEDEDMMAAFNVSQVDLSRLGYPDDISFTDPMSRDFLAKPFSGRSDVMKIQSDLLPHFQSLGAYPNTEGVMKALKAAINGGRKSKTVSSSSTRVRPLHLRHVFSIFISIYFGVLFLL